MAQVLVVADDLTGANATGARFARAGMRVATVAPRHARRAAAEFDAVVVDPDSRHLPAGEAAALVGEVIAAVGPVPLVVKRTDTTLRGNVGAELEAARRGATECDAVVAHLDSRHLPADEAAALVGGVCAAVGPVPLVVKRSDTTLRGNVGAELEAAWRAVRGRTPAAARVRALFAPAFPASGRVTVDGVQLLDGVPLERTELAVDPLSPITGSVVADIVARQSPLAVRRVSLRDVTGPDLADRLAEGDEPVVLCDALTEEHIADTARAAAEVHRRDGTVWVAVDP